MDLVEHLGPNTRLFNAYADGPVPSGIHEALVSSSPPGTWTVAAWWWMAHRSSRSGSRTTSSCCWAPATVGNCSTPWARPGKKAVSRCWSRS
ncbi:hypothetical protein QNM99_29450 [Pseudomonas sp. PCH446]